MSKRITILLIIFFACTGCQSVSEHTPAEKDGKYYGVTKGLFRHRWWNFYERGVSFSDGGFWQQAEEDFRQALTKENTDQRRIRTYGRHLIDYFPHRELGVVLFQLERYPEAIKELEESLSAEKSAKAEYYLDKARKARIEKENSDYHPPEVSVESPKPGVVSNGFTLTVTGTATDDTFVKEIRVNGIPVRIDLSAPQIPFVMQVPLKVGENTLAVEVTDLTGKKTLGKTNVLCDRAGPVLNIDGLMAPNPPDKSYTLIGYAHDDSLIKSIRVNNSLNILKEPVREIMLNAPVVPVSVQENVVVIAEDEAGNETRAEFVPLFQDSAVVGFRSSTQPAKKEEKAGELLLASAGNMPKYYAGIRTPEKSHKNLGNYYALIIGINDYDEWPVLKNTVKDATALKDVLVRRYGFLPENILLRTDKAATWKTLMDDLRCMAGGLGEKDNLLIYFSGHGELDRISRDGYWIPADGKEKDFTTWITNSAIREVLCAASVKGKNIMVIADSCYSGSLLRGYDSSPFFLLQEQDSCYPVVIPNETLPLRKTEPSEHSKGVQGLPAEGTNPVYSSSESERLFELADKKSRQVISSGGMEPVSDEGEDHSIFADKLLTALEENKKEVIDMEYLFHTRIWESVTKSGQRPTLGRLMTKADEDGQFVLALKSDSINRNEDSADRFSDCPRIFSGRNVILPDMSPPMIEAKKWAEKRTVFMDQVILDFKVCDDTGIQNVTVKGQKVLNRPGRKLYLNYLAALNEGDNEFPIACLDQVGNRAEQKIVIHRKLSRVYEIGSRMSVMILPFAMGNAQGTAEENMSLKYLIDGNFRKSLRASRRFNIKETLSLPTEHEDIQKLARNIGAEFVLKGKIAASGQSVQISVSVIEAETATEMTYEDVYDEYADLSQIGNLCGKLLVKLLAALPLTEGHIVRIEDRKKIILNLCESDQIKPGMRLIFFREREPGKDLGSDTEELGTARIQTVLPDMSYAELTDTEALSKLGTGEKFVMK